ncbi:MAG: DEAD/DEAH box helicase [Deltaproteobacteria bacterium]|nr:DEAD/DEAH box helicase [Deltaproteobacteria bacterium]
MSNSLLLQLPNTFRAFYGAFESLYSIQRDAVSPILSGQDLVLQAATGSGKSEAVLAPCLERVISSGRKTAVLYIIPTRALAMDLKRRFESVITERLGLNLAIRTGDIKRAGGKRPDIMFTTPESLDVMLGSANPDLKGFLFRVGTVIIDEVHPLIHQYRGRHLVYLFTRLERRTGRVLQKIAMSATIARVDAVIDFFNFSINTQRIITDVKRKIIARLLHIKQEESELPALLNDLYDTWQYRKILVFVNSRAACDRLLGIVNKTGRFQGVSELHYSNLKPLERKMVEEKFRRRPHALCIATSTLELGIDVGDVDAVLLYEPPNSVSAFLQRIGRANRREDQINFWGLCCGERSGAQVVRFLALLELSRKGMIESPSAKTLPSVLSQQVISCLYEKKRLSLSSLQSLFPAQHEILPSVFESLEKKCWLKKSEINGLLGGGWQYRNHLFDYKIWGNFPEAEEEYILEVSEKAIADIPQSIVSQMEVGDRVYIAGRRLRILKIDTGERKSVLARPSKGRDEKQLAWIGMGAHISCEVAKAMGNILKTGKIEDKTCLFARTKKLFRRELKQGEKKVVLENGIEVVPGKKAFFRYRTFIGSAGNLVLEWSIRENFKDDELFITSDEIGLECSHWISFEDMKLPVDQEEFKPWVKRHFKILGSLIPLNLFCKTLPKNLLIQELTDFLFDHRVARTFAHYLDSTSKIISGDKANLLLETSVQSEPDPYNQDQYNPEPCAIDIIPEDSLLEMEKEKSRQDGVEQARNFLHTEQFRQPCLNINNAAPLTATMVSDYFFHAQCQRRFCFKFLGLDSLIQTGISSNHDQFRTLLMSHGIIHEKNVLEDLKKQGTTIIFMKTTGSQDSRFKAFLEQLNTLIPKVISYDMTNNNYSTKPVFLSQCLLKVDNLNQDCLNMNGTGVPDLLVLSAKEFNGIKKAVIEVGDIKSSTSPRFHHKWQVAFYAWLLEKIINVHDIPAMVAKTGVLFTRPSVKNRQYEKYRFDLKAYLAAFPMLFKTIQSFLSQPASAADHRLQSHCVSCKWYSVCYQNALVNEDIQFLPGLTLGELLKLRKMGCATIAQTHAALEKAPFDDKKNHRAENSEVSETGFTLEQKKHLSGRCAAFLENRIFLKKKYTRLFPSNISRIFFIHMKKDLLTGLPCALGLQVIDQVDPLGTPIESHVWIMKNDQEQRETWQKFVGLLSTLWEKSIFNGKAPHIFHFGSGSRLDILQWGEAEQGKEPRFLWQTQPSPWTDLRRIFKAHFYMPVPGVVSLFTLGHLFGCNVEVDHPETLFHHHGTDDLKLAGVKASLSIMVELYAKASLYLESQWVREWDASLEKDSRVLPYLGFIKEEQRLQENDILTLQELTLQERMLRFRAIGYLSFAHTRLDHEGRFLYILKTSRETCPSKFRKGDFLKLAPHGIFDIQSGFPVIMAEYDMEAGEISLLSRSGKMHLSKNLLYSIEEDISDWNQAKLTHVATTLFAAHRSAEGQPHSLQQLLAGESLTRQSSDLLSWLKKWLTRNNTGLNPSQQNALALPFQYRTSMIQGPPGTGKTHLLGWTLIALIMQAHEDKRPLRIGVSALTHQAIDTVLKKVTALVNRYLPGIFPGHCIKWGQGRQSEKIDKKSSKGMEVEFQGDADDVLARPWLILGATGYGFYNLFNSKNKEFPPALDWIIFDEASQVPVPQALLSLIYSKGNFLFLGDVNQLPPIVLGDYGEYNREPAGLLLNQSIMANLLGIYPKLHQETLNITYRMNKEICAFPGRTWYKNMLDPATANAHARLALDKPLHKVTTNPELTHKYDKILDPAKPVVLVLTDHQGCSQKSDMEAELMAALANRLMIDYKILPDQMALISPHRAQNNAIIKRLGDKMPKDIQLPLVDTIERVQGAEREIIIFGITSSDPDHLLSEFLNSPNRLNVAMTRAKTKLILIGSNAFFSIIPDSESILEKNSCFKQLLTHCQKQNAVFNFSSTAMP